MTPKIIPEPDPIPLPAPFWLLKLLLVSTFIFHIIAVNIALGGGFIAGVTDIIGRVRKSKNHIELARYLSRLIPIATAFTITFGVAPLLFLQVLYGQYFYTSSIIIAFPWLSVIILLLAGYYGYYLYQFRFEKLGGLRGWLVIFSAVLFAVIGFIYTNNMVLMLTPEKWAEKYFSNPHGFQLNIDDPTVIPRYLHFLVASFAVSGLAVLIYGVTRFKRDEAYGRWLIRYGGLWFVFATLFQFAVGIWFILSLPREYMLLYMGGDGVATVIFGLSLFLALLSLILVLLSFNARNPRLLAVSGAVLIVLVISGMAVMRDILRTAYLSKYFSPAQFDVKVQTSVIFVFIVVFIAGVSTVVYMLKKVLRGN